MKKTSLLSFFIFSAFMSIAQDWVEKASLPDDTERHHPATFSIDGFGYIATGESNALFWNDDVYRYDPKLDEWEQLPDYPGPPRAFGYGVSINGKGYVGFGDKQVGNTFDYEFLNDLWEFDPVSGEWRELAKCPCEGRDHPAMIAVAGKIFVGLGNNFDGNKSDWWGYDIATDTWKEHDDLPGFPRHHPYYFNLNGMAYVGFGHGSEGTPRIYKDFYRFDPVSEEWTKLNDFPGEGRVAGTQFSNAGRGYILSGQGDDHQHFSTGEFWEYNPDKDSWRELPLHPGGGRWAPGSFVIDNQAYFTVGELASGIFMNDMWSFDLNSVSGIKDLPELKEIEVFPNPSNGILNIIIPENLYVIKYEIVNSLGQNLDSGHLNSNQIEVSEFSPGSYFLNLVLNGGERKVKPFFVEKI